MTEKFILGLLTLCFPINCINFDYIENYNVTSANWTSCEKFLTNTTFEASKVVDVDWQIFYFWNIDYESSYHIRFSYPTPMLIERFMVMVDSDLKSNVNWSASELFVETSIDLSGLFIRQEQSGLFRFIPALYTEYHSIPTLLFGMKVLDGYLGMVNCERKIAYALAPVENMPKPEQIEAVAAKLNFWSPFGHSYLVTENASASFFQNGDIEDSNDDAEDVEEREIEREKDAFETF